MLVICCRRHSVGQLNRPSTQFSESRKHLSILITTYSLSIYRCRSASCNPKAIIFGLQYIQTRPTTWLPFDKVEFTEISEVTECYVYEVDHTDRKTETFSYFLFHRTAMNAGRSSQEKVVCPSVCLSKACIVTQRKEGLSIFLNHTEDHLA